MTTQNAALWALKQIADLDPKTGSIGTAVFIAKEALASPAPQSEKADRNKRAPVGSLTDEQVLELAKNAGFYSDDSLSAEFPNGYAEVQRRTIAFARALLSSVAPRVPDVDWLSNVIRAADGNNTLGAGALAEKIVEAMIAAAQQVAPEGYVIVPVTLLEWAQQNIDNVEDEDERKRISASLGDYIAAAIPTTAELPAT